MSPGVGSSVPHSRRLRVGMACAALLHGRVPRLLHELGIARADGTYAATLARLAKLDVLVLDDFLIGPLKDQERRDLVEVLEDRYGKSSTVVTTQVPTKNWHEKLADPTMADADLRPGDPQRPCPGPARALAPREERDAHRPESTKRLTLKLVASLRSGPDPSLRSDQAPRSSGITARVPAGTSAQISRNTQARRSARRFATAR